MKEKFCYCSCKRQTFVLLFCCFYGFFAINVFSKTKSSQKEKEKKKKTKGHEHV